MSWSRRDFVRQGTMGCVGVLSFVVAGCERELTPAAARAAALPLRTLSARETRMLESLGEALVPGSAAEGLVQYIDQQLSGPLADNMLMIRYLGVRPPFADFYRQGLEALDGAARARSAKGFAELSERETHALVGSLASGDPAGWSGPPAALFHFVLRSDAIDVVYGTPEGFERLGVPYMAHIAPSDRWAG